MDNSFRQCDFPCCPLFSPFTNNPHGSVCTEIMNPTVLMKENEGPWEVCDLEPLVQNTKFLVVDLANFLYAAMRKKYNLHSTLPDRAITYDFVRNLIRNSPDYHFVFCAKFLRSANKEILLNENYWNQLEFELAKRGHTNFNFQVCWGPEKSCDDTLAVLMCQALSKMQESGCNTAEVCTEDLYRDCNYAREVSFYILNEPSEIYKCLVQPFKPPLRRTLCYNQDNDVFTYQPVTGFLPEPVIKEVYEDMDLGEF